MSSNVRKRCSATFLFFCLVLPVFALAQVQQRDTIRIPDILGYTTLKCDFHMHTVFSDGEVWPTVRVEEAWRNGLDVFSITDHVEQEYHSYQDDIRIDLNRSFELARTRAEALGLTIIRGAEITRDMPPGHFSAIFLQDVKPLQTSKWRDAVKAAYDQGAFIFWNHPGWIGQQPDGIAKWYDEHTELLEKGWLHGIEVVNQKAYYPEAQQWCLEHKLTMLGNSDAHQPIAMLYDSSSDAHRPMTLVFADNNSEESVKQALLARRTAIYWNNMLFGEDTYLKPVFERSIQILDPKITIIGTGLVYVQILNDSDVSLELVANGQVDEILFPIQITLRAGKTVLLPVRGRSVELSGSKEIKIPYRVNNLRITPLEGLPVELKLNVTFKKAKQ